ncbi:class I tRNA ligase family protein [Candidatus Vidania fulgoroideorum]
MKINIFKSKFKMRGNLIKLEKKINIFWKKKNIYNKIIKDKKRKKYIIHDGPPYANGELHLGHILNKILKDTIMKKMNSIGYRSIYIPGWDCHGTPIELNVSKNKKNYDFLDLRKYTNNQINIQKSIFENLGMLYHWNNYYKTMNYKIESKEIYFFKKIFFKNKIKIKYRIINWCKSCNSSLSEYEIEEKKIITKLNVIKYSKLIILSKTIKNKCFLVDEKLFLYLFGYKKKYYFILNIHIKFFKKFKILKKISLNLFKKIGFKIAIEKYKKNFFESVYFVNYLKNKNIKNIFVKKKNYLCSRHKKKIFLINKKQWFIPINFKKKIIKIIKKNIKFYPPKGFNELSKYINQRPDWNISREKKWGVPICLLVKNKKIIFFSKIIKLVKKYGIEIWSKLKFKNYKKINFTLDVWFDSGITHYTIINKKSDVYIEGRDQYRGWFNSSVITNYIYNNKICCKNLITHGFVLNNDGLKMSKSLGNYINPKILIDKYGVEILRLFFLSKNYFNNICFSEEKIKNTLNIYKKLRNIIKFMLSNIVDYNNDYKYKLLEIDKYIINIFNKTIKKCFFYDKKYEFFNSFRIMKDFCFKTLSGFYFENIKERLYIFKINSRKRRSCQTAINYILKRLLIFMSPYISYTSEEAWDGNSSIFLASYKKIYEPNFKIKEKNWNFLIEIKKKFNKFLEEKKFNGCVYLKIKTPKFNFIKKIPEYDIIKIFKVYKVDIVFSNKLSFEIKILNNLKKCIRCWNFFKKISKNKMCKFCFKIINE